MPVKSTVVHHNTKQKTYPSGYSKITVCSRPVFREDGYEPVNKELPPVHCRQMKRKFLNEDGLLCFEWEDTPKLEKIKNETVRDDNVKRAKEHIFDIAMCNEFTHFITWTLDKDKINRYDADAVSKKLKVFLNNKVKRNDLKYLVIPELHKDGAIHMHGLISGNMQFVDSGTRLIKGKKKPVTVAHMQSQGLADGMDTVKTVYNMPQWSLGYSTAIELDEHKDQVSRYITKYVTKDFRKIFGAFYYAGGHGLQRSPLIQLYDVDYDSVNEKEYFVSAAGMGFKYLNTEV